MRTNCRHYTKKMSRSILFVCLGNVNRSPAAEIVCRSIANSMVAILSSSFLFYSLFSYFFIAHLKHDSEILFSLHKQTDLFSSSSSLFLVLFYFKIRVLKLNVNQQEQEGITLVIDD